MLVIKGAYIQGSLYSGGVIFGGKVVLAIRGLIFGGAYIRDFTVFYL